MRILIVHNAYLQPGGEDQVFASEADLLQSQGHHVATFTINNELVRRMNPLRLAINAFWNQQAYQRIAQQTATHRAEVVHFHNTFPLISPSGYAAARAAGAAVVQTLHNFRLACISPYLFRNGKVCQQCLGKTLGWPGVLHGCYRGSYCAGAIAATTIAAHRVMGTWQEAVDLYIAPSQFARHKLLEARLPPQRTIIKPNFVFPDPGIGDQSGQYAVFVGRLSPEKGLRVLLSAWSRLGPSIPLKIVGDGPLADQVRQAQDENDQIQWLGRRSPDEVYDIIGRAMVLVAPSECYETFGRVAVEAFAKGTPVVASRLGALEEVVDHGRTGLLFNPGDGADLAAQVQTLAADADLRHRMSVAARAEFLAKYTGDINARQLKAIYQQAIMLAGKSRQSDTGQLHVTEISK